MKMQTFEIVDLLETYRKIEPKYLLICSYTIGLSYLEHQLLLRYKQDFDTRITLFGSTTGINTSFNESYSLHGPGIDYWIYKISDFPYAFHPKLYLSINIDESISLILGGANFTYPGICLNLDTVSIIDTTSLTINSVNELISFIDALSYSVNSEDFLSNLVPLKDALSKLDLVVDSPYEFISNVNGCILDKITHLITRPVNRLRIISPYFDENMVTAHTIQSRFDRPKTEILCNQSDPSVNLRAVQSNCQFYTCDSKRFMHAKVYIFEQDDAVSVLSGSANCTSPAFLKSHITGNWETMVFYYDVSAEYMNTLWDSFNPKFLSTSKYWDFVPHKEDESDSSFPLSFNAFLNLSVLRVLPNKPFPANITGCTFLYKFRNGRSISEEVEICESVSEFDISHLVQHFASEESLILEIQIETGDGKSYQGKTWVHKTRALNKSAYTRNLEEKLRRLQSAETTNWEGIDEIVNFIIGNLGYFSLSNDNINVISNTKGIKNKHPMRITQVLDLSENIHVAGLTDQIIHPSDFISIKQQIVEVFNSGLRRIILDEDEYASSDASTSTEVRNTTAKQSSYTAPHAQSTDQGEDLRSFLENIGDLRPILSRRIYKPYSKAHSTMRAKRLAEEFNISYIYDLLAFCMKLIRFLRIELPFQVFSESNRFSFLRMFFLEMDSILKFLSHHLVVNEHGKNTHVDSLENQAICQEILLYSVERWRTGWRFSLPDKGGDPVSEFGITVVKALGQRTSKDIIRMYVRNDPRFSNDRQNLLISESNIDDTIANFVNYKRLQGLFDSKYRAVLQYSFWTKAVSDHDRALTYYEIEKKEKGENYYWNEQRLVQAKERLSEIETVAVGNLGARFDSRMMDFEKCCFLNEIINRFTAIICPNCNREINIEFLQKLNNYETFECPSCNLLYIPIRMTKRIYDLTEIGDRTWNMLVAKRISF